MEKNCGVDIVKISRIEESIKKIGENFLKKIYTNNEINYCESKKISKYQSYAARFAAKEAVYKALSPKENISTWEDIEVCNETSGKPYIKLYGQLEKLAKESNINSINVSLSHDTDYAIAMVVVEN